MLLNSRRTAILINMEIEEVGLRNKKNGSKNAA
jgi:hypothetical protein